MRLPQGFTASAVACGLKTGGGLDLGILHSARAAAAAGVLTTNRVQAAPVVLTRRHLRRGAARAIVANAGNANACTGDRGYDDARATAQAAAAAVGVRQPQVLVASTGIIGVPLDMEAVRRGIAGAGAALSPDGGASFAAAILTTDTRPKTATASFGDATVVGIAKGAGMIAPEMATMLAFVCTDAAVQRNVLTDALRNATATSFNAISVDGCRSTNDCVLVLANGAAGGDEIVPGDERARAFADALAEVCASLARQIVEDGEGATKVVTIRLEGASDEREARKAARAVADSVLLRCALGGADPNWGRALAALGASGVPFDPRRVDVWLGGEKLCEGGAVGPGDRRTARAALGDREVEVRIDLRRGPASWTVLTNDLGPEYVRINAEYTT